MPALKEQLCQIIDQVLQPLFHSKGGVPGLRPEIRLEVPNDKQHGDLSTNVAMQASKIFRKPPLELAAQFQKLIQEKISQSPLRDQVVKIEVKSPGFINFTFSNQALFTFLQDVLTQAGNFGRSKVGGGKKIQIEFVSANPTGPLSVAHARQAAVGDALGNILNFLGFAVTKEYYVNDEGNQINMLGESILARAKEILGEPTAIPENGYQGEYIRDMAQEFLQKKNVKDLIGVKRIVRAEFSRFGVEYLMAIIKRELKDFGVGFDVWSHQSKIATSDTMEEMLAYLGEKGFLYEQDGALWFRSTDFGDDKDRVLEKSDGTYTYLTPDIVYHRDKFERGFDKVINIWGPDHHGYIPRLKAAVEALGRDREALTVLIVQLATIYRDGKPVSMSTRRGEYISLQEVIDEVGIDAARYFFLKRHTNQHLEFDLELAKKETPENPVYYIQYAHARINSVMEKAGQENLSAKRSGFQFLTEAGEQDLIKKIYQFAEILGMCENQLDAYALGNYLLELAIAFHKFYDQYRVIDTANKDHSEERLGLILAVQIILANGLKLLGISAPAKM